MRNVILEERSWSAEDDDITTRGDGTTTTEERDRRVSADPVMAAQVNYGYARI